MQDRRRELRLASNKEVRVIVVRKALIAIGTLRDVSMDGARIELPFKLEPLEKIDLIFDDHEQNFQCTVRWCQENEVGVSFDRPVQLVYVGAAAWSI